MKPQATTTFGAQGLWLVSDLTILNTTAQRWVQTLASRGTVTYYTAGMFLLSVGAGFLAWTLDIRPSLIFGQHLAEELTATAAWFSPNLLAAVILLLSITPNLLEFFATGLAMSGNVIVDLAIKTALLFDAATDAPMAFSIAQAAVGYFVETPSFWSNLAVIGLSLPILLLATVVVEILFLSFVISFIQLLKRWWALGW